MSSTARLALSLLAAGALSGAAAATASADSIAYLKDGDVHLTTTDGSRQFRVTSTGGFESVAQADDGTLMATRGRHLVRLDRLGTVLSDVATPVSTNPVTGGTTFSGPFDVDLAPSGRAAAYGYLKQGLTYSYDCSCFVEDSTNGAGYSRPDALTGFTDEGFKASKGWDAPEFADDTHVLLSNGPGYPSDPLAVEELGSGDPRSWFSDPANPHPREATISRDKQVIAAAGDDRNSLHVYRVGDRRLLSEQVFSCFAFGDEDGKDAAGGPAPGTTWRYSSPTLNADGTLLAWSSGRELVLLPLARMDSTCSVPAGTDARRVIPGATSPDWGPADVPTSRPDASPAPGPAPVGPGGTPAAGAPAAAGPPAAGGTVLPGTGRVPVAPGGPATSGAPAAGSPASSARGGDDALVLRVPRVRLGAALRSGLTVRVAAPAAGRIAATARRGRRAVAAGSATARGAGTVTVRLRFGAAGRRALHGVRSARITVQVTQAGRTGRADATLRR